VRAEGIGGYVSEPPLRFSGEKQSLWSFFMAFPNVVFRLHGSVLPFVMVEVCLAVALSLVALYLQGGYSWSLDEEHWSHFGHLFLGNLLAFLTVFRTQGAWSMYLEGEIQYNAMLNALRSSTVETLAASVDWCLRHGKTDVPDEALEVLRLLKLFLFLCLEHVRSTDGYQAWNYAQRVAYSFATPEEIDQMHAEFGPAQPGECRQRVLAVDAPASAVPWKPPAANVESTNIRLDNRFACTYLGQMPDGVAGPENADRPEPPASPFERAPGTLASRRAAAKHLASDATAQFTPRGGLSMRLGQPGVSRFKGNPHDPTRGKPLQVLLRLRAAYARLNRIEGMSANAAKLSGSLDSLSAAYNAMHKIDNLVLPLPYCQLLKLTQLGFVFTLPFVLASDIGAFLPVVMALISMAFFGLDQVAAELEGPFGVEPNDIPLLHKGLEFVDDCDVMVSAAQHQIDEHRSEETSEGQNAAEAGGGQAGTGEASVVACGTSEEPLEDGLTEVEQDVPVAMDGGITDG
jgi:predicted membrane chloride channel (bestrophin family)